MLLLSLASINVYFSRKYITISLIIYINLYFLYTINRYLSNFTNSLIVTPLILTLILILAIIVYYYFVLVYKLAER